MIIWLKKSSSPTKQIFIVLTTPVDLVVVPEGNWDWDSQVDVSLSNQGGPIESFYGKTVQKKISDY